MESSSPDIILMEELRRESGKWRVTLHRGGIIDRRPSRVLYRGPSRTKAEMEYAAVTPAAPGQAVAIWKPDGSVHAFVKGPAKN